MSSTPSDPAPGLAHFFSPHYEQHNRARLQHLESLGLPLANARVLELGSGPGDHTQFYVDRNCTMVAVDARQECLDALAQRFPDVRTIACDLNEPERLGDIGLFDVIHCYGVLYHLEAPARLIAYMGEVCAGFAIVETCVSREDASVVEVAEERREDYTQSSTGRASRPSRRWVFEKLREGFPFVYQTRTQPVHPEFPVNWNDLDGAPPLIRAVFVASKFPLELPSLSSQLLSAQFPSTVEELQAGLNAMQRLVWQYDSELRSKEEALNQMHLEARARLQALEDAAARAARLEASASERQDAIAEKDGIISRLDAQAAGLRSQLEAAAASNEELREHTGAVAAAAEERLAAMLEKDRLITTQRAELEVAAESNEELRRHAAAMTVAAEERLAAMLEKDRLIASLSNEAAGLRAQIEAAAASNNELRRRAEVLERAATERLEAMLEKERTITALDAAVKRQKTALREPDAELLVPKEDERQ